MNRKEIIAREAIDKVFNKSLTVGLGLRQEVQAAFEAMKSEWKNDLIAALNEAGILND